MDLVLEVRTGGERVTMTCSGKLIAGKEANTFRRSALLLMGGFDKLTIDLAGVRAVDGGGLDDLASVLALALETGKQVRITHASPLVRQMLHLANLEQCLDMGSSSGPQMVTDDRQAVA